jgi:hypothetical protein
MRHLALGTGDAQADGERAWQPDSEEEIDDMLVLLTALVGAIAR